jgi:Flp pilus assembly CpaF family ATPase
MNQATLSEQQSVLLPFAEEEPVPDRHAVEAIFKTLTATAGDLQEGPAARDAIASQVHAWAREQAAAGAPLTPAEVQHQLIQAVYDECFGLGPLQRYLADERVENIDINGCDQVLVSRSDGTMLTCPAVTGTDDELVEMIRRWAIRKGQTPREFSAAKPLLNLALRDGVRLAAVMSVTRRVHVSIRCHRLIDVTLDDMTRLGTVDQGLADFLRAAVRARKTIIVTGAVNAGKTTLLRALAAEIDPAERIATLEAEHELFLDLMSRHGNVIAFEERQPNSEGAGAIRLHDLIPQALRHNPRRIIVGEVRDREIIPMLEAINTGHKGSMCTLHADGADEVFNRILMLARRGELGLPPEVIHLYVGMARPFVIHLRHDPVTGQRYVSEVIEVEPPADGAQPSRNHIYVPGPDGRAVRRHTPACASELAAAGLVLGRTR